MADEVVVKVKIDSAEAKKKLKEVRNEAEKTGKDVETSTSSSLSKIGFKFLAFGTAISLVGKGLKWLGDGFQSAIGNAQQLDKTKFFTGISTEKLQKISSGLRIAGSSFESFASSYGSMMNFLASKTWGGWSPEKMRAFSSLGITPGEYEDPKELLMATAKALNEKPLLERNQLAGILGITEDFLYALKEGADTFDVIKGLSEETNEELKEMAKQSRILDERWEDVKRKWGVSVGATAKKWFINSASFITDALLEDQSSLWTGGGGDAKSQISSILKREGFSQEAIAGILGNAQQESSFNPNISNGSHYGLFQWDRNRQEELKRFRPNDWNTVAGQTYFMIEELRRMGKLNTMKNMSDVVGATTYFEKNFEISGGQDMAKRYKYAGVPQELIQNAVASNYGRNAGNVSQTNHITVGSVKEAGEFAEYALGKESGYAQITVMD